MSRATKTLLVIMAIIMGLEGALAVIGLIVTVMVTYGLYIGDFEMRLGLYGMYGLLIGLSIFGSIVCGIPIYYQEKWASERNTDSKDDNDTVGSNQEG